MFPYLLSIAIIILFPACCLPWLHRNEQRAQTRQQTQHMTSAPQRPHIVTFAGDFSALAAGAIEGSGNHVD